MTVLTKPYLFITIGFEYTADDVIGALTSKAPSALNITLQDEADEPCRTFLLDLSAETDVARIADIFWAIGYINGLYANDGIEQVWTAELPQAVV